MKIISLSSNKAGFACSVATSIKKYYNNNYETQFFDYLVCSLNTINNILQTTTYDNIINNLEITPINDKSSVLFKNYDNLISYHDLRNPYNILDYNNFIEKYKRRYDRLFKIIKNEKILYFIRYGCENENDINNFFHIIRNLNKNSKIYIINVYYDKKNNNYNYNINNNNCFFIPFNFYYFEKKDKIYLSEDDYYKTLEYEWDNIFNIINNINNNI